MQGKAWRLREQSTSPRGLGSFPSAQAEKPSGNRPEQEERQQWHLQASLTNSAKETSKKTGKQTAAAVQTAAVSKRQESKWRRSRSPGPLRN